MMTATVDDRLRTIVNNLVLIRAAFEGMDPPDSATKDLLDAVQPILQTLTFDAWAIRDALSERALNTLAPTDDERDAIDKGHRAAQVAEGGAR